jgi:hypothetical protein
MKITARFVPVFLVSILLLLSCRKGEPVLLRLALEEGDSFATYVIIEQEIRQEVSGESMDLIQTVGTGYTFLVDSVDEGGDYHVSVTYRSIRYQGSGLLGDVNYDSENPQEDMDLISLAYDAMLGKSLRMTMTEDGKVSSVRGADELIQGIVENTGLGDGVFGVSVEDLLQDRFGEEALREMMRNWMVPYPDYPVRRGDTWVRRIEMTAGFPTTAEQRWTLEGRKDGIATVGLRAEIEADTSMVTPAGLMFSVRGRIEGTLEVDEETGWSTRGTTHLEMSGEVEAGPTSWPISIESDVTFEPIEILEAVEDDGSI